MMYDFDHILDRCRVSYFDSQIFICILTVYQMNVIKYWKRKKRLMEQISELFSLLANEYLPFCLIRSPPKSFDHLELCQAWINLGFDFSKAKQLFHKLAHPKLHKMFL